jgi:hypothetical protein
MYVHHVELLSVTQNSSGQRNGENQGLEPLGANRFLEHIFEKPAINAMAAFREFPSMVESDARGTRLLLTGHANHNQNPHV